MARVEERTGTATGQRQGGLELGLGLGLALVALLGRGPGTAAGSPAAAASGPGAAPDASSPTGHGPGHAAEGPTEIPAKGWLAVLKRVWAEVERDNMLLIAAGCAFYAMLALFPGLTAMVSVYGLVADPGEVERQMGLLHNLLPEEAAGLITTQAHAVAGTAGGTLGWGAALALLLALYTASSGVKSLFIALNIAYEEKERRGFLRLNITALAFTLAFVVAGALGLGVIVGLPAVLAFLPLAPGGGLTLRIASWAVLLLLLLGGLAATYRLGPNRAQARWRWVTPGSIAAVVLWGAGSFGFSWYVANFAAYNQTYGVLGGVIILLMWLYLSAVVILLGAELNAELELQTRQDTTTGPARPMGDRKAYAADHTRC